MRLFLEHGFERTTVDDIVAEAGVSRRTFFRYFPSKEAAFFAGTDARYEQFVESIQQRLASEDTAWKAVCEAILKLAASYEEDPQGALAWRRALDDNPPLRAHDLAIDAQWEETIVKVLRDAGHSPLSARVRAGALLGTVRAVLRCWYEGRAEGDLTAMGREALDALYAGLD